MKTSINPSPGDEIVESRLPWSRRFILAAIAVSPLQAAFSLVSVADLKLCEIALVLAIGAFVFERKRRRSIKRPEGVALIVLFAIVMLSALFALGGDQPPVPAPGYVRSLEIDMLLYVAYALLVLSGAAIAARTPVHLIGRSFAFATWLCLAMTGLQFVLYLAGRVDTLVAFGFQTQRIGLGFGIPVLRTGPFVEGQHLGVFAACALIIALWRRKYLTALAAGLCLAYSQSTSAFIAVAIAIVVTTMLRPRLSQAVRAIAALGFFGSLLLFIPEVMAWAEFQMAKLGFGDGTLANERSLNIRTEKTELAWHMTVENPILGVGPGRFGAWFSTYEARGSYVFPPSYFSGLNRPIVENGYLQLSAESGILALIALLIALLIVGIRAYRHSSSMLALWLVVVVSFVTLSSWTFIPIWLVIGMLAALTPQERVRPVATSDPDLAKFGKAS